MKYVVMKTGGKQYKVSEGSVIEVDKLKAEVGANHVFDEVLLYTEASGAAGAQIGNPRVASVSVVAKVLEQKQGDKIRVAKFKAKARYRRVMGFRAQLTRLEVTSIVAGGAKAAKSKAEAKKTTE